MAERDREMVAAIAAIEDEDDGEDHAMSAGSRADVYARVTPGGATPILRRPRWNVVIVDGLCTYGPGYGGTVFGWRVVGDQAKADVFAARQLAAYLDREWPDRTSHRVTTPVELGLS